MKQVTIRSFKNQLEIADRCSVAESFLKRLRGLIGWKALRPGEGLLLNPCNDIHMWFMSIPIDVVFIKKIKNSYNSQIFQVTSVRENVQPWKFLPLRDWRASQTLELPIGTIQRCQIQPGDEVCIS